MRLSCNGCRVLRKGCTQDCSLRACLDWINSPESQANATVFLAKFYGRAGLMNLIESGPKDMRPAIFRSLLHDACGRILNPVYGSVGLMWSGNWQACADAVEAVLRGEEIVPQVENGGGGEKESGSAPLMARGDIKKRSVGKGKVTGKRSKRVQVRAGSNETERSPSHVESGLSQAEAVSRTCKSLELDEPERRVTEGLGSAESGDDDVDGLELGLGLGVWSERKIRRVGPRSDVVSGDGQDGL